MLNVTDLNMLKIEKRSKKKKEGKMYSAVT
jgi:hypothetical protein